MQIKESTPAVVPRVERLYLALDGFNKMDVKPANIKLLVADLKAQIPDLQKMSDVQQAVLETDLQRAFKIPDLETQLPSNAIKVAVVTAKIPTPSPKPKTKSALAILANGAFKF